MLNVFFLLPRFVVLALIRFYQKIFSFDHGLLRFIKPFGHCRFYPTCSEYAYQAIEKYGLWRGGWKSIKRLSRCHPFSKGGVDPVE